MGQTISLEDKFYTIQKVLLQIALPQSGFEPELLSFITQEKKKRRWRHIRCQPVKVVIFY